MPKHSSPARGPLLLATASALTLAACAQSDAGPTATGPDDESTLPVVLTTFTVLQDIAQNVAGEHLEIESITKTGAEIHGYEPTPGTSRRPRRRI